MKCACVVSGHCVKIELSLFLSLLRIGSILLHRVVEAEAVVVVVVVVTVAVAVVVVVVAVVVMALATIKVKEIMVAVQVVIPVVDTNFVPVVPSLVPVHLETCSFLPTRLQILMHSKH